MTDLTWILGTLGILAIEGSYLPQIFRLFRLKRADDVSVFFPLLNLIGRLFALMYSVSQHANGFSVGLMIGISLRAILLMQVLWYRRRAQLLHRPLQPAA